MEFKWVCTDTSNWGHLTIKFGNVSSIMYIEKNKVSSYVNYCIHNVNKVVELMDAVERHIRENHLVKVNDDKQKATGF